MLPRSHRHLSGAALAALAGLALAAASAQAQTAQPMPKPAVAMKMEMRETEKDMGRVVKKLGELGAKPVSTLSVEQARSQPTPADAVMAILKDEGKDPAALMAAMKIARTDLAYPAGAGTQPIRIYTPEGMAPKGGFPVIVYYHGGGFVIATLDTYEASAMALAKKANAIVASVEYRHAPENKFPASHEDAIAAYKWVIANAPSWKGDSRRIAVAGESAGGNLAADVAIMARDQKLQAPLHMLLVYPVAGNDTNTASYVKNAAAVPLGKADMLWFFDKVLAKPEDKDSPLLNIIGRADLKDLPGTTIIAAEIDPLLSEGKTLVEKLKAAGNKVTYHYFPGTTHEFFGMSAVVKDAERAEDIAAKELKAVFAAHATGSTSGQLQ